MVTTSQQGHYASVTLATLCGLTVAAASVYFIISIVQSTTPASGGYVTYNVTINGTQKNETVYQLIYDPFYHIPTFTSHAAYAVLLVCVCVGGILGSFYSKIPRKRQYLLLYLFVMGLVLVLWLMLLTTFYSVFMTRVDITYSALTQVLAAGVFVALFCAAFWRLRTMSTEDGILPDVVPQL